MFITAGVIRTMAIKDTHNEWEFSAEISNHTCNIIESENPTSKGF